MKWNTNQITAFLACVFSLCSCSYNPFVENNHTTGSPVGAVVGAGVGAGTMAAFNLPKPVIGLGGVGGGIIGYYVTTLRYSAGGVYQSGGQVYRLGDYVGIYIPSDKLFQPNSAELKPDAGPILDSVADIIARYPKNNVLISGNTSGFYRARWEQRISEERAKVITAYLWKADDEIGSFRGRDNMNVRKLNYVGYGDYFPIANDYTNDNIRTNSRIQITSYPCAGKLKLGKRGATMRNMGSFKDNDENYIDSCGNAAGCFETC